MSDRLTLGLMLIIFAALAAPVVAGDLTVDGIVESQVGGFKFPDGTVQTTAGGGSTTAQVVTVAKSGGEYTSIQSALDSITDAANGNRYLVSVGPGVYTEQVTMKNYVTIRGAGAGTTVIDSGGASPVVTAASVALLRDLSVSCTTSGLDCTGILNSGTSFFGLQDVSVTVVADTDGNEGTAGETRGLDNDDSSGISIVASSIEAREGATNTGIKCSNTGLDQDSLTMTNVEVIADSNVFPQAGNNWAINCQKVSLKAFDLDARASSGAVDIAIEVDDSTVVLKASEARASGATATGMEVNGDSSVYIYHSAVLGTSGASLGLASQGSDQTQSIHAYNSRFGGQTFSVLTVAGTTARFHSCFFSSGSVAGTGTETCSLSTDGSFTAYTSTCP